MWRIPKVDVLHSAWITTSLDTRIRVETWLRGPESSEAVTKENKKFLNLNSAMATSVLTSFCLLDFVPLFSLFLPTLGLCV
mmetsp:Transcript_16033/g.32262  ORF Transcript_16033/g.32262 Transcript_16033/m.32262 type:complete len:81 (+) Transcript_16033:1300-1542(+)